MERGGATGKDCGGDGVRRPEKCAATKKHRGQNRAKADEAGHGRRKGEVAGDGGAAGKDYGRTRWPEAGYGGRGQGAIEKQGAAGEKGRG